MGAFVSDYMSAPHQGPDQLTVIAVNRFEKAVDAHLDIAVKYVPFSHLNFPVSEATWMLDHRGVLLIKVEPWSSGGRNDQSYALDK